MDNRFINANYSLPAMQLFVKLANLCITVTPDQGAPNPPAIVPGTGDRMLVQGWGGCPHSGALPIFWSLSEDNLMVNMWDPEVQDGEPGDCPPLHTFPLDQLEEFIAKWLVGDV